MDNMNKYEKQTIIPLLQETLQMAEQRGADAADLILGLSASRSLQMENGQISKSDVNQVQALGIRLIKDNRIGIAYSESLAPADRRTMVEMALSYSSVNEPRENQQIVAVLQQDTARSYERHSTAKPPCDKEIVKMADYLADAAPKLDNRIVSVPFSGVDQYSSTRYIVNSNNLQLMCAASGYSCGLYLVAAQQEKRANAYKESVRRNFHQLNAEECVAQACSQAIDDLEAEPLPTGKYPIIIEANQLAQLFAAHAVAFSGKSAMDGVNPLRDKLGQQVASDQLTIYDQPLNDEAMVFQPFDGEGFLCDDITVIEKGRLVELLHNSETAAYFKQANNHRAGRGAKSPLGVSATLIAISAGSERPRDGSFFEITEFMGLHSGCEPISGNFSLQCGGRYYKDGRISRHVKDVTLSGNFYQMLKEVIAVGSIINYNDSMSFAAPDILFDGLNVAGS